VTRWRVTDTVAKRAAIFAVSMMDRLGLTGLLAGVGSAGAALTALWWALRRIGPRPVLTGPALPDLPGPEAPPLVALLVNRWRVPTDVADCVLVDLAARRYVEFHQVGDDPLATTVRVLRPAGPELTAYERRVLDRVVEVAGTGVAPLTALPSRDRRQAWRWRDALRDEVRQSARAAGLSAPPRRWLVWVAAALAYVAGPALYLLVVAIIGVRWPLVGSASGFDDLAGPLVTWVVLAPWPLFVLAVAYPLPDRDLPAGRLAASRWLGLRAYLRLYGDFAATPPAAVTLWERYLAYAVAVDAAPLCAAVVNLNLGDRDRVWSSFGGVWHRVSVRHPVLRNRVGGLELALLLLGLPGLCLVGFVVAEAIRRPLGPVTVIAGAVLGVAASLAIARAAVDRRPVTVTGQVVWIADRQRSRHDHRRILSSYLAVDDGRDNDLTAWITPYDAAASCAIGDEVRVTARRWSRTVIDMVVVRPGRVGQADPAEAGPTVTAGPG
jgi:hypothetical protein